MSNKNTSKNILLIIMGVLILAELVSACRVLALAGIDASFITVDLALCIITLAFIAVYGFVLYKKPHGNAMKYAMLLFALTLGCYAISCAARADHLTPEMLLTMLSAGGICFIAGRLSRIDQNKYLLTVFGVVLLIVWIMRSTALVGKDNIGLNIFRRGRQFIMYMTLCCAYFTRFKEHREAGLQDAPKAK